MYAIVEIAGQQFKVQAPQKLKVHRLELEEGKHVELGNVLLVSNDGKTSIGTPVVDGARIAAKVLAHSKGDKVLVGKKKRRKGYQKVNGHRQYLTELWIEAILGKGEKFDTGKSSAPAVVPYTPAVKKTRETVEAAPVVKKTAPAKKAPAKKTAAKAKAAPKKAPAKKAAAKKAAPKKDDKK
jgi:large subunit ribosomal protein L21